MSCLALLVPFPPRRFPQAKEQYAELSDMLGLNGVTPDDKVRRCSV